MSDLHEDLSDGVIAAFGLPGDPERLPGGQGGTWRVGEAILKPVGFLAETVWRAEVLARLPVSPAFRVPRPIRTLDGGWVAGGWEACEVLAGLTDLSRHDEVLTVGGAFHEAVADLPRPDFLDLREDPWSYGDRVAWEEQPVQGSSAYQELVGPLVEARRPVGPTNQVVHGDLLGNVMFAVGLPPAIIDWPVYWRPPAWASAVAIADALCWYGAKPELAARWSSLTDWGQMLIRALIYRMTTDDAAHGHDVWTRDHRDAYRPVIDLAISSAAGQRDD